MQKKKRIIIHSDKHEHLFLQSSTPSPWLYEAELNVTTQYKASPTTHLISRQTNYHRQQNGEEAELVSHGHLRVRHGDRTVIMER